MSLTKIISISVEAYDLLEKARLPGEEFNDTICRLIKLREQTEFFKRQSQIVEDEDFFPLDQS